MSDINNRAFLYGDGVWASFFVRKGELFIAEECYFFLMSSMRKMRMNIPAAYTLEYFQNLFLNEIAANNLQEGIFRLMVYRDHSIEKLHKASVSHHLEFIEKYNLLSIEKEIDLDLIKEININNNLFSNIYTHCPENIYAEIYAAENDLDDVIFLNPNKRIARSIYGNLLFLSGSELKIPKQTEGAYISPLLENFVTYLDKTKIVQIIEAEMIAFESQKAEEILMISEEKGIFSVSKIRNKLFQNTRFSQMLADWVLSLD